MYSKTDTEIWYDDKLRALPEDARWTFHYLLTSPHRNIIGFYRLSLNYAIDDLQWPVTRLQKALKFLVEGGFIFWDDEKGIVLIKNFLKWNKLEGIKQTQGAVNALKKLPQTNLILEFEKIVNQYPYAPLIIEIQKRKNSVSIQYPYTIDSVSEGDRFCIDSNNHNNNSNNNSNHNNNTKKKSADADDVCGQPVDNSPSRKDVEALLKDYHAILPKLPKTIKLNDEIINDGKKILTEHGYDFIVKIFQDIKNYPHLMGENGRGWRATFPWIMKPANFTKIINGTYDYAKADAQKSNYDRQMEELARGIAEEEAKMRGDCDEQSGIQETTRPDYIDIPTG